MSDMTSDMTSGRITEYAEGGELREGFSPPIVGIDFTDCPNVRSVLLRMAGADPTWDADEDQIIAVNRAMVRIDEILGLPGWMGTKLYGQHVIGEGIGEQ